mmetsp:Transcript_28418/g.68965  ORF Transcript_28418/g.68965 Transcript_28418/m.68965 type:complete len:266 (+) Transcript_28418:409-1206(+)
MVALVNDRFGIGLVHEALSQTKSVGWLAIGDLVGTVPFTNGIKHTWHFLFNVINVIDKGGPLVVSINGDDLPVSFALVNHHEDTKNLDRSDFSWLDNASTNFANVNWIIVTTATFGIRVDEGRVFPSLWKTSVVEEDISLLELTKLSLLFILLDGCELFIGGDFVLFSGELGDFADKVQVFSLIAISVNVVDVNVVPKRDGLSLIILGVDSVFESIFLASLRGAESLVASERALLLQGLGLASVFQWYQLFSVHLFNTNTLGGNI